MKTLLIFRHAQAEHFSGTSDHDRPLTEKGIHDAQRMGRLLRGMSPDQVVCSTALRALRTAKEALSTASCDVNIQKSSQLYDSDMPRHLSVLRGVGTAIDRLLMVGHNPTFEILASVLTRRPVSMKTGALAVLALPLDHWDQLTDTLYCDLVGLFYPAMLKKLNDNADH